MDKATFIGACARGGREMAQAMARLFRQFAEPLMRDARVSLGSHEAARDLVQQTFVKAWRGCAEFRGDAAVATWMRAILRHGIIDHLRATRPEVPLPEDDQEATAQVESALREAAGARAFDPLCAAEDAQARRVYEACFARFAADHPQAAAVIRWTAEDGLGIDEIAAILGRTPGATREFVSQSRKKARLYLADWYALVRPGERLVA